MKPRPTSSAFTLLELVLVLLIVAIVLALAAPSLAGFARGRAVSDAATEFVAMAQYAHDRAKTDGQVYRLTIDPDAAACSLTHDDGTGTNTFVAVTADSARAFTLPGGLHVSSDAPVTDKAQVIEFEPGGTCDAATVHFSNDYGNTVDVACLFPYDNYHIISGPDAAGGRQ